MISLQAQGRHMIDTERIQSLEQVVEAKKIEIRSALTGFLFARADQGGMYFYDRRMGIEVLMSWKTINRLQEDTGQGDTACVRIAG
jgi:hypothetical protein